MLEIVPIEYRTDVPSIDYMVAMRKFKCAKEPKGKISESRKRYVSEGSLLVMVIPCPLYRDGKGYFFLVDDLLEWDGYDKDKDEVEYEDMVMKMKLVRNIVKGE